MKIFLVFVSLMTAACAQPPRNTVSQFSGVWQFMESTNAQPPPEFVVQINVAESGRTIDIASTWKEPHNGQYGLSLVGLLSEKRSYKPGSGAGEANQSGPFAVQSRSRWLSDGRLVIDWSTTEFQSSSFRGTWTHSISPDGRQLQILIEPTTGGPKAQSLLTFRKRSSE